MWKRVSDYPACSCGAAVQAAFLPRLPAPSQMIGINVLLNTDITNTILADLGTAWQSA